MKSFQIVTLFALVASAMAFSPNQLPQGRICFCPVVVVVALCVALWHIHEVLLSTARRLFHDFLIQSH